MNDLPPDLVLFDNVSKIYTPRSMTFKKAKPVVAVKELTFSVREGETVGLVGESGSGKTTTGRLLAKLIDPSSGTITFSGQDIGKLKGSQLHDFRRNVQVVFQDPGQALDSRMTIGALVQEPMVALHLDTKAGRLERARASLAQVGLPPETFFDRGVSRLSGGQKQRVAIARALVMEPKLIICDEPVTALDLSVQAQILNLFLELQEEHGIAYLFIAHDMSVIKQLAHRVIVMYQGEAVEIARAEEFFGSPAHPYSRVLLNAALDDEEGQQPRPSLIGEPSEDPQGCALADRCWKSAATCHERRPRLANVSPLQAAACFFPEGLDSQPSGLRTDEGMVRE